MSLYFARFIRFVVEGKEVDPRNLRDALQRAILEKISQSIQQRLGQITCRRTCRRPTGKPRHWSAWGFGRRRPGSKLGPLQGAEAALTFGGNSCRPLRHVR